MELSHELFDSSCPYILKLIEDWDIFYTAMYDTWKHCG